MGNEHELRFSGEQGFFDKSLTIRFLIGLVFVTVLFLFLHFKEEQLDVLELGSKANRYVVAQVDFEFLDEQATAIVKQEAIRDLGKIYNLTDAQIDQRIAQFEQDLLQKNVNKEDVSSIYTGLDTLKRALEDVRLTDPRTLQKLEEFGFSTNEYQVLAGLFDKHNIKLTNEIWQELEKLYFPPAHFKPSISMFIIGYFKGVSWEITENIPSENEVRTQIYKQIPDRISFVKAGTRIVDQGETITVRHLAMMQAMKEVMRSKRNLWHPMTLFGTLMMTIVLTVLVSIYMCTNYLDVVRSNRKLSLLITIILLTLLFTKLVEYFLHSSNSKLYEWVSYPLFLPLSAILITNLLTGSLALAVTGFLALLFTMALSFDPGKFVLVNVIGALVAILSIRYLTRRKEIFIVCAKVWCCCLGVILAIHFYDNTPLSFGMVSDMASTAIFMAVTAVLSLGLLPLLEVIFKVMSDVSLMEYMDPNHQLLRRLSFETPGTYQHTLVVCNIVEAGAQAIGANSLFCRAATLYHDIGKMATPQFFTENQEAGMDVHKLLTPIESAKAIMAHVSEGVAIARKAGLPEQFIDIIKEHHGTTLVYYFYRKALDSAEKTGEHVDEKEYRYAGPRPRSKESALIMIADSFEAASRSIDKIDEVALLELINRLIREKVEDGQFDYCPISYQELSVAKRAMVKMLTAAFHSRIRYPARPAGEQSVSVYG